MDISEIQMTACLLDHMYSLCIRFTFQRKDAKESAKTESSPSLSPPLVSVREKPVQKIVALEESVSDIDLNEPSSKSRPNQDVRPFVEKRSEAVQNTMKSVFLSWVKRRLSVLGFLLLLITVAVVIIIKGKPSDHLCFNYIYM